MRKTILMLINGFGIERKNSTSIYSHDLMPNFDNLIQNNLFGRISNSATKLDEAFRDFSIKKQSAKNKEFINFVDNDLLNNNEFIANITNDLTDNNKLHIFYVLNNFNGANEFKQLLEKLNPNKNKKIFVHFILSFTNIDYYKKIVDFINVIAFNYGEFLEVGFVVGKKNIESDNVYRIFLKEMGEQWQQFSKKFDVLKTDMVIPEAADAFMIKRGLAISNDDIILYVNNENVEMNNLFNEIRKYTSKIYSIYPYSDDIKSLLSDNEKTRIKSFNDILKDNNIRLLVLSKEDSINSINYYFNGKKRVLPSNITYALNDDNLINSKDDVLTLFSDNKFDGIIINYDIGYCESLEEYKRALKQIDEKIKYISDASLDNDYTFIISSLYGINKKVKDSSILKILNCSGIAPIIYQSSEFKKGEYSIINGNNYDLMLTFLTNICDNVKSNRLIHKRSKLEKLLKK